MVCVAFALFPFDAVLSAQDFAQRFASLPRVLLSLPDSGRPLGLQVVMLAATAAAAVPLGMRLSLPAERSGDPPTLPRIAATGAAMLAILFGATLFVLSARVSIATFGLRLLGVLGGALLLRWLSMRDLPQLRERIAGALPVLVPAYLLLLVYANGLLTRAWVTPEHALAGLNPRGLLPLWYNYIESKAHAVESNVGHAAMYAPVGVLAWLRRGATRRTALTAATMGGLLALAIEVGRGLKPGMQPDFNIVLVGAIAGYLANRAMSIVWPALLSLPKLIPQDAPAGDRPAPPITAVQLPTAAWLPLRMMLAAVLLASAAALVRDYPLGTWQAPAVLAAWVALLWRWPVLWLVGLPAIAPALDLGPWTGWIALSEADIAVLATLAVLLLRAPPTRQDLWFDDRVPLFPRLVLALAAVAWLVGMLRGFSMTGHFPGGSDNPYLTWLNTVRLGKPLLCALALLPFMRARQRVHGDAAVLFGAGVLVGLALVGVAALAERIAFTSLSDIHSNFRITATFSSMHVGGGHIGAYLAFAMPFIIVCLRRPRLWTLVSLIVLLPLSGYTLAVTFARTAYMSAGASMVTTSCGWMIARHRRGSRLDWLGGAAVAGAVAIALVAGLHTHFMRSRVAQVWNDLAFREANWEAGLGRRNSDLATVLFGMGTGSYPRFAALRSSPDQQPGTYVVRHEGNRTYLATKLGPDFYYGQKVPVTHDTTYTVMFDMRAPVPGTQLTVLLCTKLLLYSAGCHELRPTISQAGVWQHVAAPLLSPVQRGRLEAPVELSFATGAGVVLDLAEVQLVGPDGRNVAANGDFAAGTARWFFTSDEHWLWRILDAPLSVWFEGGVLGFVAVTLLVVGALGGGVRAVRRGEAMGAPIAGAMLAVLLSGCFDNVFEAPRIALLYDLAAMLGLMLGWPPREFDVPGVPQPGSLP